MPSACLPARPPALAQVIEDFGLLSFHPLAIEDRDSVRHLAALIDKSNGYVFAGLAKPGGWVGGWFCGEQGRLAGDDSAGQGCMDGRAQLPACDPHARPRSCFRPALRCPAGQPAPELQYSAGVLEEGGADLWEQMQERYIKDRDLRIQEHPQPQQPQQAQQAQQQQPTGEQSLGAAAAQEQEQDQQRQTGQGQHEGPPPLVQQQQTLGQPSLQQKRQQHEQQQ